MNINNRWIIGVIGAIIMIVGIVMIVSGLISLRRKHNLDRNIKIAKDKYINYKNELRSN